MKKDSLLTDETIVSLRAGGLAEELIAYFGQVSGSAKALNNSKNPTKAAHTMLLKPKQQSMLEEFLEKQLNPAGDSRMPEEVEEILVKHRRRVDKRRDADKNDSVTFADDPDDAGE